MAITNFVPQIWSAQLLSILKKNLVFAGSPCVNRNYEGEIAGYGSSVQITAVGDVSIVNYVKDTDLTVATLTDSAQQLFIDQAKAFAFEIDDIDMRQARSGGALMSEAADRSAFGLSDVADKFVAGKMVSAASNSLGTIDASSVASNVYDQLLVPASVALDVANVPHDGRFIVVDPATYGKLQLDTRFIRLSESGTDALHNGMVGNAAGFTILKSNNCVQANRAITNITTATGAATLTGIAGQFQQSDVGLSITGTGVGASAKVLSVSADGSVATATVNSTASAAVTITLSGGGFVAVAGSQIATAYAEQINQVEAFRQPLRFADALKGLHLYGAKVVRPQALVTASVKTA